MWRLFSWCFHVHLHLVCWEEEPEDAVSDTSSGQKSLQVAAHANAEHALQGWDHIPRTPITLKRANSFSDTERSRDKSSSARKTYRSVKNSIWGYLRFRRLHFCTRQTRFAFLFINSKHSHFCWHSWGWQHMAEGSWGQHSSIHPSEAPRSFSGSTTTCRNSECKKRK